jgi:hypothetical protein
MTCLTVFGLLALITKPLPRRNGLPIIAGVGYPAFFLYGHFARTVDEMKLFAMVLLVVTIQFIALVALGYILQGDVIKEARSHPREQTA